MAAGIATAKAAVLQAELAELNEVVAYLGAEVARREAAARAARAPSSPPATSSGRPDEVSPDPVAAARAAVDAEMRALAILAGECPEKGSREFWRGQIDQLGRHLAPGASSASQRHIALADPRGRAFLEALQQCRT
jgi:hypothetical protein